MPFLGTAEFFSHMSYMTEECYTAHPWILAAKWHLNRVLILHYVIRNPCSAITFQCAQWSKLMSHFYSKRTRLPMISFFFSVGWETQSILEKIVMDVSVGLFCEMKMYLLLSSLFFCLILWDVWAQYTERSLCSYVCVSAFTQLPGGYCEGALAIGYITFTYKAWLLSGQHMGDNLPKAASSLLADSKDDAVGYCRIVMFGCFLWVPSFPWSVCLSWSLN